MIISRGSPGVNCKNKKQGISGVGRRSKGRINMANQQKASGEGEGGWVCHDN